MRIQRANTEGRLLTKPQSIHPKKQETINFKGEERIRKRIENERGKRFYEILLGNEKNNVNSNSQMKIPTSLSRSRDNLKNEKARAREREAEEEEALIRNFILSSIETKPKCQIINSIVKIKTMSIEPKTRSRSNTNVSSESGNSYKKAYINRMKGKLIEKVEKQKTKPINEIEILQNFHLKFSNPSFSSLITLLDHLCKSNSKYSSILEILNKIIKSTKQSNSSNNSIVKALKSKISHYKDILNENALKELKYMKLLNTLRSQGVDIDNIYSSPINSKFPSKPSIKHNIWNKENHNNP